MKDTENESSSGIAPATPAGMPSAEYAASIHEQGLRERRAIQISGAFLIASAAVSCFGGLAFGLDAQGSKIVGASLVDALIGLSLLRGNPKYKYLAILRVFLGLVVWTGLWIFLSDFATAAVQVFLSTALLLLLTGKSSTVRLRLGAALCVAVLLLECAAIGSRVTGSSLLVVSGETIAIPGGTAYGTDIKYMVHVSGDFRQRDRSAMKRDNPNADLWLVDARNDAHVMVVCLPELNNLDARAYHTSVINALSGNGLKVVTEVPLRKIGAATRGRAELVGVVEQVRASYIVTTTVKFGAACTVYGWSTTERFNSVRVSLSNAVDSFRYNFNPFDGVDPVPANLALSTEERTRLRLALQPPVDVLRTDERLVAELMDPSMAGESPARLIQVLAARGIRFLPLGELDRLATVKVRLMKTDQSLCASMYSGTFTPEALLHGLLRLDDDDLRFWGAVNAKAMKLEYSRIGSLAFLESKARQEAEYGQAFVDGLSKILEPLDVAERRHVSEVLDTAEPVAADSCAVNIFLHRADSIPRDLRERYLRALLAM